MTITIGITNEFFILIIMTVLTIISLRLGIKNKGWMRLSLTLGGMFLLFMSIIIQTTVLHHALFEYNGVTTGIIYLLYLVGVALMVLGIVIFFREVLEGN